MTGGFSTSIQYGKMIMTTANDRVALDIGRALIRIHELEAILEGKDANMRVMVDRITELENDTLKHEAVTILREIDEGIINLANDEHDFYIRVKSLLDSAAGDWDMRTSPAGKQG